VSVGETESMAAESWWGRELSITTRLLILTFWILLPLLLLTGLLSILYAGAERRLIEAERAGVATRAVQLVESEVGATIATLRALALSSDLRDGDLAKFHQTTTEVTKTLIEAIALVDRTGAVILSTRTPFGTPSREPGDVNALESMFLTGIVTVSDVMTGTQRPVVHVSVPVFRDGDVVYALSATLSPARLGSVLAEAGMKSRWIADLVDRAGVAIAGGGRNSQIRIGQRARLEVVQAATGDAPAGTFSHVTSDGIAVDTSFRRSTLTGWTVVIGVPQAIMRAPMHQAFWIVVGGGGAVIFFAVLMAMWAGYRIAKPARRLQATAIALAHGRPMPWRHDCVREFNDIGMTFDRAAEIMRERDAAQSELGRTTALLNTVLAATPDLIYAKDRDGSLLLANPATLATIGKAWPAVAGRTVADWCAEPGEAAAIQANDRAVIESGHSMRFEELFTSPAGRRIYLSTKAPLRNESGEIAGIVGVSTDITHRKAAEDHRDFLMRELSHRSKNLLAVTQSIARQSARSSPEIGEFQERFSDRLTALARLHDLLINEDWAGAPLADLVAAQLAPFAEAGRFEVSGPTVLLSPAAAQTISLALHELATNAAKYGALSVPSGKVKVRWNVSGPDDARVFCMSWSETGGPVVKPPTRKGFGSIVLERMGRQLCEGATVRFEFRPEGLSWTLRAPAEPLIKSSERYFALRASG